MNACEHAICPDCGHEMADHRFGCPGTEEALDGEHAAAIEENRLRDELAKLQAEYRALLAREEQP